MTTELTKLKIEFEGRPITIFRYRGQPAWIAREVGEALGYADGKRLVNKITGEWQEEFNPETDYRVISGEELQAFKELQLGPESGPSHTPSMLILFERGLYMALAKTRKPAGRRLRRLLADKVLPQIIRDGRFDPEREVTLGGELVDPMAGQRQHLEREARAARRIKYRRMALQQELEYRRLSVQHELEALKVSFQQANAILYAADQLTNQVEADAARREAICMLAGRPVFFPWASPPPPATPPKPDALEPGTQQSPPAQQGFPVRPVSEVGEERERRLVQLANRQSSFGAEPPPAGKA